MVKRKLDMRLKTLIENGISSRHRTLFVVVGNKAKFQIVYLYHILSRAEVNKKAKILWCYKDRLSLPEKIQTKIRRHENLEKYGQAEVDEDDPLSVFRAHTNIKYVYYKNTDTILGSTFNILILQDFEALTPNLLCRTFETVEGGGLILLLLENVSSLRQLYTMQMDVHSRYRSSRVKDIIPRFNERFILSLASCKSCLVMDDSLQVLPISSLTRDIKEKTCIPRGPPQWELDPETIEGKLVAMCKTKEQGDVVTSFMRVVAEKTLSATMSLTAARGRGKSAAMGLALAGALSMGYANVFVTSPHPNNVGALFTFLIDGLKTLGYEKHVDFNVEEGTTSENIVKIVLAKEHRQVVQYINPTETKVLSNAELLVIDEAAAIPMDTLKGMLSGPYLVFLASTVGGYEGTGRSLRLKLLHDLRKQSQQENENEDNQNEEQDKKAKKGTKHENNEEKKSDNKNKENVKKVGKKRRLIELEMSEPIRYGEGDPIERWLFDVMCLDASKILQEVDRDNAVNKDQCELFFINRDTLFSYHKLTEKFLHRTMGLLVASHYRNTPDDLQQLSDAPTHELYVLCPKRQNSEKSPEKSKGDELPMVYCVIQICLEGQISRDMLGSEIYHTSETNSLGKRPPGDLIPWSISNLFQDQEFPTWSGARVVRIATHPNIQGMGYGRQALKLLVEHYKIGQQERKSLIGLELGQEISQIGQTEEIELGDLKTESLNSVKLVPEDKVCLMTECVEPRESASPLLLTLAERRQEKSFYKKLRYLGSSFGASIDLMRFWRKSGFSCVYIAQTTNKRTGEHSCLYLKDLTNEETPWLPPLVRDFRKRVVSLGAGPLRTMGAEFVYSLLADRKGETEIKSISLEQLRLLWCESLTKKLRFGVTNQRSVATTASDCCPGLAHLVFTGALKANLSALQKALLVGLGVQLKSPQNLGEEFGLPSAVVLQEVFKLMDELHTAMVKLESDLITNADEQRNEDEETETERAKEIKKMVDKEITSILGGGPKDKIDLLSLPQKELQKYTIDATEAKGAKRGNKRKDASSVSNLISEIRRSKKQKDEPKKKNKKKKQN